MQLVHLMQTLSHATRAYICNADGLPGFLTEATLLQYLVLADESGKLEKAKRRHKICFDKLSKELRGKAAKEEQMKFLSRSYPCLYIYLLKQ